MLRSRYHKMYEFNIFFKWNFLLQSNKTDRQSIVCKYLSVTNTAGNIKTYTTFYYRNVTINWISKQSVRVWGNFVYSLGLCGAITASIPKDHSLWRGTWNFGSPQWTKPYWILIFSEASLEFIDDKKSKNEFPGHHNTMIDDTKTLETTNVKGVLLLSRNLHRDHKQDRDASFVDTIFILRQFCLINSCAHHELNTSEGYGPRSSLQVRSLILYSFASLNVNNDISKLLSFVIMFCTR